MKFIEEFVLEFERPIVELRKRIEALREMERAQGADLSDAIIQLEQQADILLEQVFSTLSPWQQTMLSRHPSRHLSPRPRPRTRRERRTSRETRTTNEARRAPASTRRRRRSSNRQLVQLARRRWRRAREPIATRRRRRHGVPANREPPRRRRRRVGSGGRPATGGPGHAPPGSPL